MRSWDAVYDQDMLMICLQPKKRCRQHAAGEKKANCKNLKYVKIPAGTEIAPDAFEGCGNVVIDREVME